MSQILFGLRHDNIWGKKYLGHVTNPTFGKVSFIGTVPNERNYVITPNDVITRFDLSVCQVAMTVDLDGKRTFFFGDEQVKEDIVQHQGRVMFVDNIRLINRVEKYQQRGFDFSIRSPTWFALWSAWSAAQEVALSLDIQNDPPQIILDSDLSYEDIMASLSDAEKRLNAFRHFARNTTEGVFIVSEYQKEWISSDENTTEEKFQKEQQECYNTNFHRGIDSVRNHRIERAQAMVEIICKQKARALSGWVLFKDE